MKKPDDAPKTKTDEDAAKNAQVDADQKKADEEAMKKAKEDADQKSEADAAAKKAEAKHQDDLVKQLTQPRFMLTQAGVQLMNDNPDLGKNGKVIYIPGLYYESIEVLLDEFCRIVMTQCGIENVTYTNNILTGKESFQWKNGTLKFRSFDNYFCTQLGMITQQVEMSSKPLNYSHSEVTGNRRAWLEDVQPLYIYSDVID